MSDANPAMTRTGFAWDEWFMWHVTGVAGGLVPYGGYVQPHVFVEDPEPKRRIKQLLDRCGMTDRMVPVKSRPATEAELCYFHTPEYVALVREGSKGAGGMAGPFTPFGTDTFEIASRAVGALLECVDQVVEGKLDNAYAFLRPPGHHAQAHQGMGMCIFGSIAIAAHHARRVHKLPRVAVIDYDAHHGNGVQEAFYADPSVLTISLHQRTWFGIGGEISERGEGAGDGTSINIPMPSGTGDGGYIAAFERVVIPALHRFKPDLILVAAGFDIAAFDMVSTMMVSSEGFRTMNQMLVDAAKELCGGRIILEQEGGYNPWATPFAVLATMEALSGIRTGVDDPFLGFTVNSIDNKLLPHQEQVIEEVRAAFDL